MRTEIRRLRLKLAEYYTNEGSTAPGRLEIPKGAYEVVWREVAAAAPSSAPPSRLRFLILSAALTAIAITLGFGLKSESPRNPPRTIAILPFVGSPLPDTVSDDLSRRLTRSKALRVTGRNSTAGFRGRTESLDAIGKKLAIEGVVEGSLQAGPGGELAIEARLTDLRTGREIWSRKVTGPARDLARLEDELTAGLLSALALPALRPMYLPKSEALNLYIEGLQIMRSAKPDGTQALKLFEKAAKLDPGYAAAEEAQARIYFVQTNNGQIEPSVALPKAEEAVRRALRTDPQSSEAHTTLGNIHYARHAWQSARSEYETAIELDPSSALAHTSVATLLTILGRFDEAERELRHAIALDPLWYGPHYTLAEVHYYARRYDQSFSDAEEFARRFPGMGSSALLKARARRAQGRNAEAARYRSELPPNPIEELYKLAYAGNSAKATVLFRSLDQRVGYLSRWSRADIAMELGDHEQAIRWLEESLAAGEPDLCSLNVDPVFDPVRKDPRCQRILHDLNLLK